MVHKLCITLLFLFYRSSPSGKCDISDEVVAQVRNAEMTHKNLRFAADSVGILIFFKVKFLCYLSNTLKKKNLTHHEVLCSVTAAV